MTTEEFYRLRRGCVVFYGSNKTPRLVIQGPADRRGGAPGRRYRTRGIVFAKLRASWTDSYGTWQGSDIAPKLTRVRGATARAIRRSLIALEQQRAGDLGYDWKRSWKTWTSDWTRLMKLGWSHPSACGRFPSTPWSKQ